MISEKIRELVVAQYKELKSYREVAKIFKISPNTVRNVVLNISQSHNKKRGRKRKLTIRQEGILRRRCENMITSGEQVTAPRLASECGIDHVHTRTINNYLRRIEYIFEKAKKKIVLSSKHKAVRVKMAKEWISNFFDWSKVIFTDEKRFNLDGPDSWCSWQREGKPILRNRRQQGGGNVQVWGMVLPDNTLHLYQLSNRSKSADYTYFLESMPLPVIFEHLGMNFIFMQDNASIHVSKESKKWFSDWDIPLMDWPARSPDLNIIENVWSMLARIVYQGPQYKNKASLWSAIQKAVDQINSTQSEKLDTLRKSIPRRLVELIEKQGALTKY